jgi:hypothetical protein
MQPNASENGLSLRPLVTVSENTPGGVTAQVVGLPELSATAPTREEALKRLRFALQEWQAQGRLTTLEIPLENPLLKWAGHAKDDPMFEEYLEEIRRYREEVDRREQQEFEAQSCSNISSTPTT